MAALFERHPLETPIPRVVDLRRLRAEDLDALLEEETQAWRDNLSWDFQPSADLVRRFVHMQALSGFGLTLASQVIGYGYYVCEERKGLLGDLYVANGHPSVRNENLLLEAMLTALKQIPYLRRVESQLMMLRQWPDRRFPFETHLENHPREFMMAGLGKVGELPDLGNPRHALLEPWSESRQDDAAHLIAECYRGHVDSLINDQYRSPAGARKFLLNIVQYPGCGAFYQPGTYLATEPRTRRLLGVSLASCVARDTGHVTQICVHPEARGKRVGYELLRHSMLALADHGCRQVSLTVTSSNTHAIQLYEDVGFVKHRRFSACVWDW